jgi:aldehyde dehydrogenase (NAD+)
LLTRCSIVNPTTGRVITSIPEGLPADVELALDAAHNAFNSTWGHNCPGFERGKYLIKVAELIERDIDQLASIESLDNGKGFVYAKLGDVGILTLQVTIPGGILL